MCDYSLMHKLTRPAQVGEELTVHNFGTGTTGFCSSENVNIAVCVLPGTEIAFAEPFKTREWGMMWQAKKYTKLAVFRQINKEQKCAHHDALETPAGEVVLLTSLIEGQKATILQLPAAPKNEKEAQEQTRVEVKA